MNKRIITAILAFAVMAVLSLSLFSCGGNNGGENNGGGSVSNDGYSVTIVDQNGSPVVGAKLTLTTQDGIPFYLTTDSTGAAKLSGNYGDVTATLTSLPTGYKSDKLNANETISEGASLKITVEQLLFTIKVVDQDGNGVADVSVSICEAGDVEGVCKLPTTTDENGEAFYPYEATEFKAKIIELPDGYSVDDINVYYTFTDRSVTIKVTKN